MATTYLCLGCNKTFEGRDPIRIPNAGALILDRCPVAAGIADEVRSRAHYNTYENFLETQAVVDTAMAKHPVTLAVAEAKAAVPAPKLAGAWGSSKLKVAPESPQEKARREQESAQAAILAARRKAAQELDAAARRLIGRIDADILQGRGGKSSRFPLDLEYGTKKNGNQVSGSLELITAASTLWLARGADYAYRAPAYKQLWDVHMANFERAIVSGDWGRGKHNFHVIQL
jgi:hypothetical protein